MEQTKILGENSFLNNRALNKADVLNMIEVEIAERLRNVLSPKNYLHRSSELSDLIKLVLETLPIVQASVNAVFDKVLLELREEEGEITTDTPEIVQEEIDTSVQEILEEKIENPSLQIIDHYVENQENDTDEMKRVREVFYHWFKKYFDETIIIKDKDGRIIKLFEFDEENTAMKFGPRKRGNTQQKGDWKFLKRGNYNPKFRTVKQVAGTNHVTFDQYPTTLLVWEVEARGIFNIQKFTVACKEAQSSLRFNFQHLRKSGVSGISITKTFNDIIGKVWG